MKKRVLLSVAALVFVALFGLPKEGMGNVEDNCQGSTVVLTNTIYSNSFNLTDTNLTFFTNMVCGATSYTWSIEGFTVGTSSGPFFTLDAEDFLQILPLGGCDTYNANVSNGVYSTEITVQANAGAQNSFSIPIYISGVTDTCKWGGKITPLKFPKIGGFNGGPDLGKVIR